VKTYKWFPDEILKLSNIYYKNTNHFNSDYEFLANNSAGINIFL